jgi:hypothetical protein
MNIEDMADSALNQDYKAVFYANLKQRLIAEYGFKHKGDWLNNGKCHECGNSSLIIKADKPLFVRCTDDDCEFGSSINEFLPDIFDNFSQLFPPTDNDSNATANAYFEIQKGIPLAKVKGLFKQDHFDRGSHGNKRTATVRFTIDADKDLWWEHLIEPVEVKHNDGSISIRTENLSSGSLSGVWWNPSNQIFKSQDSVYICNGILNALTLIIHGYKAVALLNHKFPEEQLKPFLGQKIRWKWALNNDKTGRKQVVKFHKMLKELGEESSAVFYSENISPKQWHQLKVDWSDLERIEELRDMIPPSKYGDNKKIKTKQQLELINLESRYLFHYAKFDNYNHYGKIALAESYQEYAFLEWAHKRSFKKAEFQDKKDYFCFCFARHSYSIEIEKASFDKHAYYEAKVDPAESGEKDLRIEVDNHNHFSAFRNASEIKMIATFEMDFKHFLQPENGQQGSYGFTLGLANKARNTPMLYVSELTDTKSFKKACQQCDSGANWMGDNKALDWFYNHFMRVLPPRVRSINYVGYHEPTGAYIFDTCAIYRGQLLHKNEDGFFQIGKDSIKTTSDFNSPFRIVTNCKTDWYPLFKSAYGIEGVVVLAWWTLVLFTRQINEKHKGIPYFSLSGESGSGKTYMTNFLWKLLGQDGERMSFNPATASKASYVGKMSSVSNIPAMWNEAQNDSTAESLRVQKRGFFEMKAIKGLYDQEPIATKSWGGNMTNNTLGDIFRSSLMITQNPVLQDVDEAVITRVTEIYYRRVREGYVLGGKGEKDSRTLYTRPIEDCSGFLFKVISKSQEILSAFDKNYAEAMSFFEDEIIDFSNGHETKIRIKHPRIREGHAKILAMANCLPMIIPEVSEDDLLKIQTQLLKMAAKRQSMIDGDNELLERFWAFFDECDTKIEFFGQSEHITTDLCNHAGKEEKNTVIAVHLNSLNDNNALIKAGFDIKELPALFKSSKNREYLGYKDCRSTVPNFEGKRVKCYIFKKPAKK